MASKTGEIQPLRTNRKYTRDEELIVHNHMEVEGTDSQNLTLEKVKQEAINPFGPDLVPVTLTSVEPQSEREVLFKIGCEDHFSRDREHFGKLQSSKRQRMMSQSESAIESLPSTSPISVSTDDLLDCLVNPKVTRIVAQLLIQGKSL